MNAEPITIKRYENRKLYDSSRSTYVTLEEIAALIREGREVKVVDAKTGEDLTKSTLALIILEGERQKKNLLPLSFMYQLIKYGESVQGIFQEYLSTGLDAFLSSQQEAQKRLREWTEGRLGKDSRGEPPKTGSDREASLKEEVDHLKRKLDELERRMKVEK
ncbi:MAG: polyhydroxyalkanoate synthesis regulator DNA-binding domain-containing protein [Candidatus Methylomirabilaceae bacterium]